MNPDTDQLEVIPTFRGSGVEPEEAPARRIQSLPLAVNLAPSLPEVEMRGGRPALRFPGEVPALKTNVPVTSEMTAGEAAAFFQRKCSRCVHFQNEEWKRTKKIWESSPSGSERRNGITKMVIKFATDSLDRPPGPADFLHASRLMNTWGVCAARTEEVSDLVIAHPEAQCDYFQDRDRAAKREGFAVYDKILRLAQGRK